MADTHVEYYNGQRVEVSQSLYNDWIAGNPGDEGRFGAAFVNDDQNLALHPAYPNYAAGAPSGSTGSPYATPTPTASPVGQITTSSPNDGTIFGTGTGGGLQVITNRDPIPPAMPPMTAGVSLPSGVPAWAIALAILLVFLYLERR